MMRDMTAKPIHGRSKPALAVIAAGALLVAAGVADAASTSIYKCSGDSLGFTYTDQPCTGGERLDIRPGEADPEAVARLQVARDQLARSAAARVAEQRRAAALSDLAAPTWSQGSEGPGASYDYGTALSPYDYALPWYPVFAPMHRSPRHPHPARPVPRRTFAPNPPYIVPRW
jgi:hypothetical protein